MKLPLLDAPPPASVTSVEPTVKLCSVVPLFTKVMLITWPAAAALIVAGLRLKLTAVTVIACGCAAPPLALVVWLAFGVVVALSSLLLQAASSSGPTAARARILISMVQSFHRALINRHYEVYDRRACKDLAPDVRSMTDEQRPALHGL